MQRSLLLNPWNGEIQAALLSLTLILEEKAIRKAKTRKAANNVEDGAELSGDNASCKESNDGSMGGDWTDVVSKKKYD